MKEKIKIYIVSIAIALGVGGLSALLTMGNMDLYSEIVKPALAPPSILFPIVTGLPIGGGKGGSQFFSRLYGLFFTYSWE